LNLVKEQSVKRLGRDPLCCLIQFLKKAILTTGFVFRLMVNLTLLIFPRKYVKAGNLYVQKITPRYLLMLSADARFKDNVIVGGLMLCKAPVELVRERNDYYQHQAESQIHSVDNNLMRENDPRMPLFHDRKTKVTFGSGN
jgi:hypothetical protein